MAYSPLVKHLLAERNITSDEEAELFLHPDWERDTHDPFLMKDMEKVCERIARAIQKEETILIWSDYDMDGIPGAVLLYDFFRTIGYAHVRHHTPHRNKDGFGLNTKGIDDAKKEGVSLIITIDCGIGDSEHIAYAQEQGVDVVVTDHHIPPDTLPSAYAILNPKQKDCAYPEKMLCGAGVAFKLVQGLRAYLEKKGMPPIADCILPTAASLKWLLDMAGMATVADMVPLRGENRAIAHFGLIVLRKSRRLGLQALLKKARTDQRFLTEEDIGFTIAPRINAASRMGHAKDAFALLASTDPEEAGAYADALDAINTERKTLVSVMKREIHSTLKKRDTLHAVIVLGNPNWKPSLLGLVASGLAEEFARPVFLWGREEGTTIKGSCRAGGGANVYTIMHEAREHFLEYGGHAFSGGFSVAHEKIHTLEEELVRAFAVVSDVASTSKDVQAYPLSLEDITRSTYREIQQFAPFGEGNPKPVFLLENVPLKTARTFGKAQEHLELSLVRKNGTTVKVIAFFTKLEAYPSLKEGGHVSLLVHLEESHFMGKEELRLRLVDVV